MFPDSEIKQNFALGSNKVGCAVNYGLKRYYQNKFMSAVKSVKIFTACFDESLNHISNRKQMDIHLLYFDGAENKVVRLYVWSSFMGYDYALSNLSSLKETLKDLDYVNNLLQVSIG